jgi:putative spermidine/putrescine transport system substrate-binding protein
MTIARRKFLAGSAIGIAALAMPAVRTSAATRKITLGGYFDMADAIKKYWIEPFQQKFDVQVFYDPGNSINQISKMLAERGNPAHSVMLMDESFVPTAQKEGLIVPIDKTLLPILEEVNARFLVSDGYGVGIAMHLDSLAYNTSVKEPTSWEAMWDPALRQQVAMASIQHNDWYNTYVIAAHLKSGRPINEAHLEVEAGFEKLRELKPNLLTTFVNAANAVSMMEQGELMLIGAITSKNVFPFIERGVPIRMARPKEGSFALLNCATIVKGGPEPELSAKFLNFGLSAEVQSALAEHVASGPVNKNAVLPARLKGIIPSTPAEFDAIHKSSWPFFLAHRAEWTDRWNKLMAS